MVVETLMKLGMTESDFWKTFLCQKLGKWVKKRFFEFKGYLRYKIIFSNKVALNGQLMGNHLKKKCFVLKISRFQNL